jgi:DNA repair exonuclease SbcCD nuclease subunit
MRIIITADIHFGYKDIQHTLWAVKTIREYADEHAIDTVIVLGDLFHNRKSLDVDVLSYVYNFFDETKSKYNQDWLCFPGNHDMFLKNSWDINSLSPLKHVLTIVESYSKLEIGGHTFWVIPFINYEPAYMEVLNRINDKAAAGDILLTHIGAQGAKLNECFLIKNWNMINFNETKFGRVYAGHFHCYQNVGGKLVYCGSPIPLRFDEGAVDHGFLVVDLDDDHKEEFVTTFSVGAQDNRPPNYLTLTDDPDQSVDPEGDKVRVLLTKDYTEHELDEMRDALIEKGAVSVQWMKPKEESVELPVQEENPMFGSPSEMFVKFVEHDNPKDLDPEFLFALNDKIAAEANEIIANMESDDA